MKRLLLSSAFALAACAGNAPPNSTEEPQGPCKAEPGQAFVGQKATGEVGTKLLKATKARTIRWVPPRTAVTMDFRPDRLTVSYDDDMVIERVSCT